MIVILFCLLWGQVLFAFDFHYGNVPQLQNVGFADGGIVKRNFIVTIPGVPHPYNPSIISHGDGYILALRHDFPFKGAQSTVALVKLDHDFKVKKSVQYLDTGYTSSEDPRLYQTKDGLFVIYTNISNRKRRECHMGVSQIDTHELKGIKRFDLNFKLSKMEKNWTPFVHDGEPYFIYKYVPQLIMKLKPGHDGQVELIHGHRPLKPVRSWEQRWGPMRGGSSAIKVGDEYLTFFHSSFVSNGIRYYVIGALTFNANPPFQMLRISPAPILFKGIYDMPVTSQVWFYPRNHLRVLFPGGVVKGNEDGRDVYYVFCGENDVAIRSVVIDRERLFNSLILVK